MKVLRRIPRPLRNRYALSALGLLLWIALFDRHDLWTVWKNQRELARIREKQEWYTREIERLREQHRELTSDPALLEKFARERYLMKRPGERVVVLVAEGH
jgi:cell division protein FtsB